MNIALSLNRALIAGQPQGNNAHAVHGSFQANRAEANVTHAAGLLAIPEAGTPHRNRPLAHEVNLHRSHGLQVHHDGEHIDHTSANNRADSLSEEKTWKLAEQVDSLMKQLGSGSSRFQREKLVLQEILRILNSLDPKKLDEKFRNDWKEVVQLINEGIDSVKERKLHQAILKLEGIGHKISLFLVDLVLLGAAGLIEFRTELATFFCVYLVIRREIYNRRFIEARRERQELILLFKRISVSIRRDYNLDNRSTDQYQEIMRDGSHPMFQSLSDRFGRLRDLDERIKSMNRTMEEIRQNLEPVIRLGI